MHDIEYRWIEFMEAYMAAHPDADREEVERDLLCRCTFDPDAPYIVDLAARVLESGGDDFYEEAA